MLHVAFDLLHDELTQKLPQLNLLHLAVRCFEADSERFIAALTTHNRCDLLTEVAIST